MNQNIEPNPPILIVGMARSGTTLVSHILGSMPNVHIEVEPHALWKTGNFKYLSDEEFDITDDIVSFIRSKFTKELNGKTFIEKSPINSLRPEMVHAVFPGAKIVYVERDPVRCIYSNYTRSLSRDSFKLSIILKKYFVYTGSNDLSGAISDRKLFQQLAISDLPDFIRYTLRMFSLRRKGLLPFGPKLKNFVNIVRTKGLLAYHVDVYNASMKCKEVYKKLYGDNFRVFRMEDIMNDEEQTKILFNFVNIPYTQELVKNITSTFDNERVTESVKSRDIDKEIIALL